MAIDFNRGKSGGDGLKVEMQKNKKMEKLKEIIRFMVNGFISFLVDYGLLYGLTEFMGLYYLISSALSFTASVAVNYLICVFWVFEGVKGTGRKSRLAFIASSLAGLGINQGLMWVLVDKIGIYYMAAKIISTVVVMFWNYVMKKKALTM